MKKIYALVLFTSLCIITTAQNVGISTALPKYRFHVSGGGDNVPVTFGLGFSDLYGEPIMKFVPAATNYLSFGFSGGTNISGNIAEGFVLTRTGFVGIGHANPQHPLSVGVATSDGQLVNFRSYSNVGPNWKGSGAFGYTAATVILGEWNGKAQIGGHNATLSGWDDLYLNSGGGNVAIGVSSITSGMKLEVGGASKFNGQMNISGYKIINVATPTAGTDGVNKDYVDNAITGNDDWDKTGVNLYPKNYTTTNVGIGTNTPTGKLHIAGSHAAGIMSDANDRPSVGITGAYPQLVMMSGNLTNTSHGPTIMLGSYDSGASGAHKHWSIGTSAQNSTFLDIGYFAGSDLNPHSGVRNYGSTTLMTILSSGNVGISQIAPTYKLDVTGDVRATSRFLGRYFLFDTRSVDDAPSTYSREMALEFKSAGTLGVSGSTYGGLMTIAPWTDNSGGLDHQLFFNDGGISYRTGASTAASWNAWSSLLTTTGGTTNYIPKFNGAGSLTNSSIFDNGSVGIGTNNPQTQLHILGAEGAGSGFWGIGLGGGAAGNAKMELRGGASPYIDFTNNTNINDDYDARLILTGNDDLVLDGADLTIPTMAGTGNRSVLVNPSGKLIPSNAAANSTWNISSNMAHSPDDMVGHSTLSGDDVYVAVALPFTTTIEGVDYSTVTISTNGWVSFGSLGSSIIGGTCLPTSSFTTPTIFWYWTDLATVGTNIRYQTLGNTGNRVFIVDFEAYRFGQSNGNRVAGQVQIHEGSGLINVKYRDSHNTMNGQNAVIGFQLHGGSSAKAFPITCFAKVMDDNRPQESWSVSPTK